MALLASETARLVLSYTLDHGLEETSRSLVQVGAARYNPKTICER